MLCWGNFCGWTSLIRTAGSAPHIAFCVFLLRPSHRPPCTRERRSSRPCLACTPSMSIAWIGGTRRPALKSVRIGRVVPCAALRCSFRPPVLCGLPWRGGGGGSRDTSVQLRVPCFFRVASFLKVFVQHLVALHGCPVPDSSRRGKPANTCTNGCHHSPLMIDDATNDMINSDDDEAAATENGADFFEAAAQAAMNAANVIAG